MVGNWSKLIGLVGNWSELERNSRKLVGLGVGIGNWSEIGRNGSALAISRKLVETGRPLVGIGLNGKMVGIGGKLV